MAGFLFTGCVGPNGTPPKVEDIVTPARVQAVVALGVNYGALELIKNGKRDILERTEKALQTLKSAEKRDMVAIATALRDGGLKWFDTAEGLLVFSLVESVFHDEYGPEQVLNNTYADAVIEGALRGISMALASTSGSSRAFYVNMLEEEAKATRPKR